MRVFEKGDFRGYLGMRQDYEELVTLLFSINSFIIECKKGALQTAKILFLDL